MLMAMAMASNVHYGSVFPTAGVCDRTKLIWSSQAEKMQLKRRERTHKNYKTHATRQGTAMEMNDMAYVFQGKLGEFGSPWSP